MATTRASRWTTLLAALPALALGAGCPSFTTMGSARTLPARHVQAWLAPGYTTLHDFQRDSGSHEPVAIALPNVEVGARLGVTDEVEVGGKLWLYGAELDGKFAILRPARPEDGVAVSVAPGVSHMRLDAGSGTTSASYTWIHLPVLVGFPLEGGSELTLGPRISDLIVTGGGTTQGAIWVGGSVGLAWRLGPWFRLLPEVSMAYPVAGLGTPTGTALDLKPRGAVTQVGLGLLFGGE